MQKIVVVGSLEAWLAKNDPFQDALPLSVPVPLVRTAIDPFQQREVPSAVFYRDIPLGGYFTHNGVEFVRIQGGHRQLKGRHPKRPHTLPPLTPVTR